MSENKHNGLYHGGSHKSGADIPVVVDGVKPIRVEGNEYHLCKAIFESNDMHYFENKTNKEILDEIFHINSCKFEQGKAESGDFIICKLAVQDTKKHNRGGTIKEIINSIQGEHSCNLTANDTAEQGGELESKGNIRTYIPKENKPLFAAGAKFKKGDSVIITGATRLKKQREEHLNRMRKLGLESPEKYMEQGDKLPEVLKLADSNSIAVITKIESSGSPSSYVNLKFENGFECSVNLEDIKHAPSFVAGGGVKEREISNEDLKNYIENNKNNKDLTISRESNVDKPIGSQECIIIGNKRWVYEDWKVRNRDYNLAVDILSSTYWENKKNSTTEAQKEASIHTDTFQKIQQGQIKTELDLGASLAKDHEKMEAGGGLKNNINLLKITRHEIQDIISGKVKIDNGEAIQKAADFLRRSKKANTQIKWPKSAESDILKKYIVNYGLLHNNPLLPLGNGTEQEVFFSDDRQFVIKLNNLKNYNSWEEYFNSLLMHNLFFKETSYELIGFREINGVLYPEVKQPFITAIEKVDVGTIKEILSEISFVKTGFNDYYRGDLQLKLCDIHPGNVIEDEDGLPCFIDTIFYLNASPSLSMGGGVTEKLETSGEMKIKEVEQLIEKAKEEGDTQLAEDLQTLHNMQRSERYGNGGFAYSEAPKKGYIYEDKEIYITKDNEHYATNFYIYNKSNESVGHAFLETPKETKYMDLFEIQSCSIDKHYAEYLDRLMKSIVQHLPRLKTGLMIDQKYSHLPAAAGAEKVGTKLIIKK